VSQQLAPTKTGILLNRLSQRFIRTTVTAGGRRKDSIVMPWLFLAIPLALLITFTYIPVGNMIWYSFTSWDGLDQNKEVVGFENFVKIFTEPEYWQVFAVSLYYFAASFLQMGLALYFATILSFKTRFRSLFKGILFFPYLINAVAIAFIFLFFFRPDGTLDAVLSFVGLGDFSTQWLGNPDVVNYSLAGVAIWRYIGLNFVLFLGAIQSIPGELYEAADLDGANKWHQFRYIIAPGIQRIISLSAFELPYIITGGANGSETFVIQTIQTAFVYRKVGLASAMAVILLIIVLIVTWIQRTVVPDEKVSLAS
jgi:ABC-type sugar transport system permease subunit